MAAGFGNPAGAVLPRSGVEGGEAVASGEERKMGRVEGGKIV